MRDCLDRRECEEIDDVVCLAVSGTGRALLLKIEGKECWLPVSQIHEDSEVFDVGHSGTLVCSRWILEQKGLV